MAMSAAIARNASASVEIVRVLS